MVTFSWGQKGVLILGNVLILGVFIMSGHNNLFTIFHEVATFLNANYRYIFYWTPDFIFFTIVKIRNSIPK